MYTLLNKKRDAIEGDEGFTLIELMVVVLIIGILMAIAIPTFLSAKNGANAKAAQENVRNALTTEAAWYSNNQTYTNSVGTGTQGLAAQEPNIPFAQWVATSWTANTVYVESNATASSLNNGTTVALGALGKDGNCYYIVAQAGLVYYAQNAAASSVCTMPTAASSFTTAWTGGSAPSTAVTLPTTWYTAA